MPSQIMFFALLVVHTKLGLAQPTPRPENLETLQSPPASNPLSKSWSKEAILTLVGVIAALLCFAIGLAWPSISKRLHDVQKSGSRGFASWYIGLTSQTFGPVVRDPARESGMTKRGDTGSGWSSTNGARVGEQGHDDCRVCVYRAVWEYRFRVVTGGLR